MGNLHHVYITAHGSYASGNWVGEAAQIGVRLTFAPSLDAPAKGAIYTPVVGGEIVPDYGTQAGTNGTLAKTWTARIGPVGSLENADATFQIDAAQDMWTFLNTVKTLQFNQFRWTHVKVSAVDELGFSPVVSSVYTFTTPLTGSVTSGLPPQVAMALSTRANLVGRRGRGRIYLPALGSSIMTTDGIIGATPAATLRTAFKDLIDDLQEMVGLDNYVPIVAVMSNDSDTAVRPVEIRTGNRLDTIQSRRRQVVETYTTTAL